ncbi:MerR family transcriptional regulator [Streptomyces cirratus]
MEHAQWVGIGEAAALTGTTPNAIRHMHRSGLLPEPGRGPGERRRYGYEDVVRILWVRGMTELGTPAAEVRSGMEAAAAGRGDLLAELEASLERHREQAGELLSAVRRLHAAAGDLRVASSPFTSSAPARGPGPVSVSVSGEGASHDLPAPATAGGAAAAGAGDRGALRPTVPAGRPAGGRAGPRLLGAPAGPGGGGTCGGLPGSGLHRHPAHPHRPAAGRPPLPPAMSPALSRLAHLLTPHPNPD